MAKAHTAVGITIVRAPGGGLVLVEGAIDLSKAKSLSPVWTRELKETRPVEHLQPPNKENGRQVAIVSPTWTKVGETRVHGERADRTSALANRALARMLDEAVRGKELSLELLEAMVPPPVEAKPELPKTSARDAAILAERAMGFIGLPDAEVRKRLLSMGRRKSDVDRYITSRKAALEAA